MVRTSCVTTLLIISLVSTQADAQDGRLQHVRDDVRSSAPDSKSNPSANDCDSGSSSLDYSSGASSGERSEADGFDAGFVGLAVLSPFIVPMAVLKDEYALPLDFAPHPYADTYRGYQLLPVVYAEMYYDKDFKDVRRKEWAVRVLVENGNDFGGINRLNGQVKLENASRWGVITNWNCFHESLSNGQSDETLIGDTNLTYRFAQNEVASMYAGLGFRMMTDRHQTDFGINFTYGGDWFPVRPLVVSASFDAGTLGNAGVVHARGSFGAIFGGCEVFAGYDFLRIGGTNLQGPMAGVRWWF
jgi:hypothetical protein